jgi:hypothetical protein
MRGIMRRIGEILFGAVGSPPPSNTLSLSEPPMGMNREEYERQIQRLVEREARLKRMGYDLDTTARRVSDRQQH